MAGRDAPAIELLWGGGAGDGGGGHGRSRLSLDRIVATAVELADADGLGALSMRRVADRLGFTTMSLYRHVPGRAELVELMRDAVFGELAAAPPGDTDGDTDGAGAPGTGGGWRADLECWAREDWALHLRHLWLVHTARSRRLPGPNAAAAYDRALGIVERTGLPARQVVAVVSLVTGFVETAARQAEEILREQRDSGVSQEQWWHGQDELFGRLLPYPAVGRLWRAGGFAEFEDPFDFGLARTLDGVEQLVRARGGEGRDENRDENLTRGSGRDCPVCGTPLDPAVRGRPRDYCSRACRQRAYRQRRPSGPPAPSDPARRPDDGSGAS
ncbi:TetR/AcrR family transcriptional regulator [Rugosimonospora acidiphila]|uniref:TetR/AcrR family transcriptional regulator n=1 Tax=Rugosimonospora acidiphila TaxID=556531 RepID=UPI0031E6B1A1